MVQFRFLLRCERPNISEKAEAMASPQLVSESSWGKAGNNNKHSGLQSSGMLSRDQLLQLFNRFSYVTSTPEVKKRIKDAVNDKEEAVMVTTAIQEEILSEIGVDPRFGIACLGKVNATYQNDRDLMIQFYRFAVKEEMACDEAKLEPDKFAEKIQSQQKLQEQQFEMLKKMRKFPWDDQSSMLEELQSQMVNANFDDSAAVLTIEQIQEIARRRSR
ncbi:uncharacterized protein LOC18438092 isoform X1 [Amborella trichopoda]|uniref:Uncharacterized protein n=1 Tax=Amborella trichopoda TaxID=13333 RepID=W1PIW5_AMBTC|nr:uncharacterized protein LOC18438092 isoform X1 [Amborella trichopoda]ERN09927.1 hypothetical protein AMTR_s00013p00179730 [Amborella trichopoda]|eukprot:XP_006848346.1 uncharacterized protein LOC18438092 isoform X1 [Amborella trichopoda]